MTAEIVKGSRVFVARGQDKGKTGTVERVVASKRPAFYVRLDSGELFLYSLLDLDLVP